MGLVYGTTSAQVIQVVKKMDAIPEIIPKEIDKNVEINYPNYSISTLFEPPFYDLKTNKTR